MFEKRKGETNMDMNTEIMTAIEAMGPEAAEAMAIGINVILVAMIAG